MLLGLIAVLAAVHTEPVEFMVFGGAVTCLAGIFCILYQSMDRMSRDEHYLLEGKRLALVFVLAGVSLLLAFLSVGLD